MARTTFEVVKAEKVKSQPKKKKPSNSKYAVLAKTLRKLDVGDYVIVKKNVPIVSALYTRANVKHNVKGRLGVNINKYSFHHMVASSGEANMHDIIIKREI